MIDFTESIGYWRVMCQTSHHPGQWQSWFRHQCCAVGWHPSRWKDVEGNGWTFDADRPAQTMSWARARNALSQMRAGDKVAVMLPRGRVARLGEIVRVEAHDDAWNPIVKPSRSMPFGENGRRIQVRWSLLDGPADPNVVVQLPDSLRNNGQDTITRLSATRYAEIAVAVRAEANWVGLHGNFAFEQALSDYIAMHPHRLEDGMVVHPSAPRIREWAITPEMRIDVVLLDQKDATVLVECKQGALAAAHLDQLSGYMQQVKRVYPEWDNVRGLLVHGGSRQIPATLREHAHALGISLVHHELRVDFSGTG